MANLKSSKKDILRSRKNQLRNASCKSQIKTVIRKSRAAVESADAPVATVLVKDASRLLDKAVSKGVIHKRQAARRKSRLARQLTKLEAA